jgi:hypothetical protein
MKWPRGDALSSRFDDTRIQAIAARSRVGMEIGGPPE